MAGEYLRKKTYLGWKLHGRIVARVLAYWVGYHLVLWGGIFAYQYLSYRSASFSGDSNVAYEQFINSFLNISLWFGIYAVAVGAGITWDVIRLTHRVIGPLKRVESTLARMSAGEKVQPIKFRKGDLIESFEESFNRYLKSLLPADQRSLNPAEQTTLAQAQRESEAVRERLVATAPDSSAAAVPRVKDAVPHVEETVKTDLAAR
jgi:hypothetical protein